MLNHHLRYTKLLYFEINTNATKAIAKYANQCGVNIWCIKARFTKRDMIFISEIPINFKP